MNNEDIAKSQVESIGHLLQVAVSAAADMDSDFFRTNWEDIQVKLAILAGTCQRLLRGE